MTASSSASRSVRSWLACAFAVAWRFAASSAKSGSSWSAIAGLRLLGLNTPAALLGEPLDPRGLLLGQVLLVLHEAGCLRPLNRFRLEEPTDPVVPKLD